MSRPMLIVGPPGSGKTLRAREEAARIGKHVTISFYEFAVRRVRPWLAGEPAAVIVEEMPPRSEWAPRLTMRKLITTLQSNTLTCEQQGKEPFEVTTPKFIFTSTHEFGHLGVVFEVIALGKGGPGRGQGNKQGSRRVPNPKKTVLSQRYSETEKRLIESVAGGEVGAFIHDAAVDRARQFAEQEG